MVKLLSIVSAAVSLSVLECNAFIAPGLAQSRVVRLGAKLEGREIDGVLKPTNNFLLVKVAAVEDETAGGILLTGSVSYLHTHLFAHRT